MTCSDDHSPDMTTTLGDLDEPTIDAILGQSAGAVPGGFRDVAALLRQLSDIVEAPAVPPSSELAAMLAHGLPSTPSEKQVRIAGPRPLSWIRARRVALAVGLSAVIGLPAVGMAAAHEQLPAWAQNLVEAVIEATTPFSLPGRGANAGKGPERQESPPSSPGSYEPEPGAEVLPRPTDRAIADIDENMDAANSEATTAPTGPPQPTETHNPQRDTTVRTNDPSTTPAPAASVTTPPSSASPEASYATSTPAGPVVGDARTADSSPNAATTDPSGANSPTGGDPSTGGDRSTGSGGY